VVHKSILEKIGGFSEFIWHGSYADFICWLRVTTQTDFAFVDESLVIYDDHPQTSIRANETSSENIKSISLNNFTNWAIKNKLYFYILIVKIHVFKKWVKEILSYIIRKCYKK
jgi:hypothetical protein